MSEMSWQLRHPDYGLMRIDLEETRTREGLSLIHISEPTRREWLSRMPSSA